MICEACQNIFRGDLQFSEGEEPGSYVSNWRTHHKTIADWSKAKSVPCQICYWIFYEVYDGGPFETSKSLSSTIKYRIHEQNGAKALDFFKSDTHILRVFLVPLKASLSSCLRSTVNRRDIAESTASIQSFSQARSWISTCLRHHRNCGRSTIRALYQYYPTRLLDLQPWRNSTDIELRLCTTYKDPPGTSYMTLSHCWGALKCLTLTSVNYKYLEAGFKLIELPKSFRDAVEITRNLGIRYLWIDALCILQDSHKDWRHEAAMMMKVYENSHFNISALAATDSEQGCFSERHEDRESRIIVETDWGNELNPSYDIYPETFWGFHVEENDLSRRAWVFQERLLAPRILHYGRGQLLWECLELDACDTYPDGLPYTDTVRRNRRDSGGAITKRWKDIDLDPEALRRRFALEPASRSLMYKYWHQLVHVYSSCKLTRAEDKLVAISGLAKRVQSCLDDEYLAGLWKRSLPSELCWVGIVPGDGFPRRSSSYRAPTWSWASTDSGTCFEEMDWLNCGHFVDLGQVYRIAPPSQISQASPKVSPGPRRHKEKALESFIRPVTILATGVDPGFIRLTGSLIPALIKFHPHQKQFNKRYTIHLQMLSYKSTYLTPDIDLKSRCGQAGIFFLPIMTSCANQRHDSIQGLLLELVDPVNQLYERIGFLRIYEVENEHDTGEEYDTEEEDSLGHVWRDQFEERVLTLI